MRLSEYLRAFPSTVETALANHLTTGFGRITLAMRMHRNRPRTVEMLDMLAVAHSNLRDALAILITDADPAGEPTVQAIATTTLPRNWDTLVSGDNRDVIAGLIGMALEMTRDAAAAMVADAEVETIRELVRNALELLSDIRDDALGNEPH